MSLFRARFKAFKFSQDARFAGIEPEKSFVPKSSDVRFTITEQLKSIEPFNELFLKLTEEIDGEFDND